MCVCVCVCVCRPFDPALYEDEVEDENEILDEEGRARLKLKVTTATHQAPDSWLH